MNTPTDFIAQVASAYQHLYDFVQLRTDPLADSLITDAALTSKERSWQLHRLLLDVIDELSPGDSAPVNSREWRRHKLMVLRYVNALDPQAVADRLAVSRRQYYREHATALEDIAAILWERRREPAAVEPTGRAELLQVEVARLSQNEQRADAIEELNAVLALLRRLMDDNAIHTRLQLPPRLPVVGMSRSLLRQVLMGLLGTLAQEMREAIFRFSAQLGPAQMTLEIEVTAADPPPLWAAADWFVTAREMLVHNHGDVTMTAGRGVWTLALVLPLSREHTLLAIDDNADVLALYDRYLTPHGYRVLTAQTADTAFELVRQARPFALLLDLMMPDHDGWELLQGFADQTATAHIPVIVCSVLKQRDLALALGAAGFIEKPITEQVLLSELVTLRRSLEHD